MAALTCSELISSFSRKTFSHIKWDLGDQQHLVPQYLQKEPSPFLMIPYHVFALLRDAIHPLPLKAGIMHVSKYFSYAIDVNGVIK